MEEACKLVGHTRFSISARRGDAPGIASCVTSIAYVFKEALGVSLPFAWVGNMPRALCSLGDWKALQIEREDAHCGDLLFVKRKGDPTWIVHVAMVVDGARMFHCFWAAGTAKIEQDSDFFGRFEQVLGFSKMVRYIDYRSEELRKSHQGAFLKDTVLI